MGIISQVYSMCSDTFLHDKIQGNEASKRFTTPKTRNKHFPSSPHYYYEYKIYIIQVTEHYCSNCDILLGKYKGWKGKAAP